MSKCHCDMPHGTKVVIGKTRKWNDDALSGLVGTIIDDHPWLHTEYDDGFSYVKHEQFGPLRVNTARLTKIK